MVVVEADDVNGLAPEQVVTRRGFIAAGSDGTRSIVAAHDVSQVVSQQRVDTHLTVLCQRRGIMTGI